MKLCKKILLPVFLVCCILLSGCPDGNQPSAATLEEIPAYSGSPYVILADNEPDFSPEDMVTDSFESYSPLDLLGRCGVAVANIGVDLMPTEDCLLYTSTPECSQVRNSPGAQTPGLFSKRACKSAVPVIQCPGLTNL